MTKTLTEQWREGTLPEGLYYIEGKGTHDIALIRNRYCPVLTSLYCEDTVFESDCVPVAPVPSYDKVKDMSQKIGRLELDNEALEMAHNELVQKMHILEKKLEIATKALKEFKKNEDNYLDFGLTSSWKEVKLNPNRVATEALKEMEGVKK